MKTVTVRAHRRNGKLVRSYKRTMHFTKGALRKGFKFAKTHKKAIGLAALGLGKAMLYRELRGKGYATKHGIGETLLRRSMAKRAGFKYYGKKSVLYGTERLIRGKNIKSSGKAAMYIYKKL